MNWWKFFLPGMALLLPASRADADTRYDQRMLFDNSTTPDHYFQSGGKAAAPSLLRLMDGKLPVETGIYLTGPNALRLEWTSMPGGIWTAEVQVQEWRNRRLYFPGTFLYFWCYSAAPMQPANLPRIVLRDADKNFTAPLDVTPYAPTLAAGRWVQIKIRLDRFTTASIHPFEPHRLHTVVFMQGAADQSKHMLVIDEIGVGANSQRAEKPALHKVEQLHAQGFERHIDLSWNAAVGMDRTLGRYVISRSIAGQPFRRIGMQVPGVRRYADFLGKLNTSARYKVTAEDIQYRAGPDSEIVEASTFAQPATDEQLMTMVQEAAFRYYWDGAHPTAGLSLENIPGDDDIVAVGASGFGIMALVVGVERGFITRAEGLDRLLKIASFLQRADRYHGAWPHFLNGSTGRRMPVFDMYDNGADLVETSFLMQGLLSARQYFQGPSAPEKEVYRQISELWNAVEWDWFRRSPNGAALYWHWSPEYTWYIDHPLTGWNEVMITYLLAIASPNHSVPSSLYYTGWAGIPKEFINGRTFYGIKLDVGLGKGGPLFFTQYSFMGFDPRVRDRFTNYFENNRHIAQLNFAYCQENPGKWTGYGPSSWGITAVDGPNGYVPYEPDPQLDDGTIAPTGAIGAFPYTPTESLAALKYFYRDLGDRLWDVYGFRDAFNLRRDWFARINMGLNQAPMVVMIENYRTGLVWKNFMANPEMQTMLQRTGLKPEPQ